MKVLLLILVLLAPFEIPAMSLSFSGNGVSVDAPYLNLSLPDGAFTLSWKGVRYGKISDFEVTSLLRPDLLIWEDKSERRAAGLLNGFSCTEGPVTFFLSPVDRLAAGAAVRKNGFGFSFLLHGRGKRSDDVLAWSNERGGERGEAVSLSFMGEHLLLRSVFYLSDASGMNAFFSAGVSHNGVTLTYSRGRITAFESTSSLRREVLTLDIRKGAFSAEYTLYRGRDPYAGGKYRSHGMNVTVLWKDDVFFLRSDYSRIFSEEGKYSVTHSYEALVFGCGIKTDGKGDPVYVFSHDGFRIESNLKTFSVSATLKGEWWSVKLSFNSELKLTTSVSLSLSQGT